MSLAIKAAVLGAFATTALAHGTVTGVRLDGVFHQGFLLQYYYDMKNNQPVPEHIGWYAENLDNGFIAPAAYDTTDINCHKNAKTVDASASIAAGGKIDWLWTDWPVSHVGPIITYVAPVDDYATATPGTLKWVKIDAAGYDPATKTWAAGNLSKNNNTWTTTVPTELKAGKYVFRHEIIALHSAASVNGAQNYPQCLNIEVTGSGTQLPEGTLGENLYKETDPGIMVNVYASNINYVMPGPALAFGSGSNAYSGSNSSSDASAGAGAGGSAGNSTVPSPAPATTAATPDAAPAVGDNTARNALPEEFTMSEFITWLKAAAPGTKARRHARQF